MNTSERNEIIFEQRLRGLTCAEIGHRHGIGGPRVRQIIFKKLAECKKYNKASYSELMEEVWRLNKEIAGLKRAAAVSNLTLPVSDLLLSVRSHNCLKNSGINTIDQLVTMNRDDLMGIPNMGVKSANEILEVVGELLKNHPRSTLT